MPPSIPPLPAQPSEFQNGEIPVKDRIRALIELHSRKEGKKITVTHPGFSALPKEGRKIIETILTEAYRRDFEILRKAFDEKLELFLRTASSVLTEAKCEDGELSAEITEIRQNIAETLREKALSDEDIEWLSKISFSKADIIELSQNVSVSGVIAELKQYTDTYQVILGDKKYIKKILKMPAGLRKLKALRSFNSAIKFNGYHLSQIVRNAGWEEKLRYFEDPAKLKALTDAGFNGYHLSQIVVNKGWEEKLRYFEDPAKLKALTVAGFEASHLSQIVRNAGWEEKLNFVLSSEAVQNALKVGRITHSKLAKMMLKKGWHKQIQDVR